MKNLIVFLNTVCFKFAGYNVNNLHRRTTLQKWHVGTSMIYLHAKFYMPLSSGSAVITIKTIATENIRMTAMFFNLNLKNYGNKRCIVFWDLP
jgi:hypothetical protein